MATTKGKGLDVVILSRTSQWGLAKDARLVEQILRECNAAGSTRVSTIAHMDPVSFTNPQPVDIQIHLEVPCKLAWPWAKINIVVINPEWWYKTEWAWAVSAADVLVFKCLAAAKTAMAAMAMDIQKKVVVVPWRSPAPASASLVCSKKKKENRCLYVLGGSVHKAAAARCIVAAWQPHWPQLEVLGTPAVLDELKPIVATGPSNIVWNSEFLSDVALAEKQATARYHCVASTAEAWGYTFGECVAAGSLPLWCDLPIHEEVWGAELGDVGHIRTSAASVDANAASPFLEGERTIAEEDVRAAAERLFSLDDLHASRIVAGLQRVAAQQVQGWRHAWKALLAGLPIARRTQPIVLRKLPAAELPRVAVCTLVHNRPKWFTNAARNILQADYPTDKLLWVVVDDGEGTGRVDEQILRFQQSAPSIRVEYVSLPRRTTVGAKRNRACEAALQRDPAVEMFVVMDDDDHYPKSSILARATYMRLLGVPCVYCSRIQMYDCRRFISAMNVPPLHLSPAQRVSEATLAYTPAFWRERGFPADTSVAEGEGFLVGREGQAVEIPPEGVIVSFIHGGNSTSRRVPADQEPNGCHYGFEDEYFLYLTERGEDTKGDVGAEAAQASSNLGVPGAGMESRSKNSTMGGIV